VIPIIDFEKVQHKDEISQCEPTMTIAEKSNEIKIQHKEWLKDKEDL
jgi:hypothetical protein